MPGPSKTPSDRYLREHPRNTRALIEIRSAEDSTRTISGIATTPHPDRYGDIVLASGARWKTPLPLLMQHDQAQVIGTVLAMNQTPAGIGFRARVAKVSEAGTLRDRSNEAWQMIRTGLLREVSIGFRSLAWKPREDAQGMVFTEIEILELSVVAIPANAGATINEVAEAASFEAEVARRLRIEDEPAWMTQALAESRARYAAERAANPRRSSPVVRLDERPKTVGGVVRLSPEDIARAYRKG